VISNSTLAHNVLRLAVYMRPMAWRKCRVYLRCCRKMQSPTYWS